MQMTLRQISVALDDAEARIPELFRALRQTGDTISQLVHRRDKLDHELAIAARATWDAASLRNRVELAKRTEQVRELQAQRNTVEEQWQTLWTRTLEAQLQPIVEGLNAGICLEPVLKVLKAELLDLPDDVQARIHKATGQRIAWNS
jgi:ABC-type transporter Mla subunit MlaD